jgi:arsenate reductase (glutaredoxin)
VAKKEQITIWHKSNCAKSCEVMTVLKKEGVKPTIFEYLVTPPTEEQVKEILSLLGIPAAELIRKKEPIYKEQFADKKMTEAKWIKAMVKYPILIERPILIKNGKALIGRPTERIYEIIK